LDLAIYADRHDSYATQLTPIELTLVLSVAGQALDKLNYQPIWSQPAAVRIDPAAASDGPFQRYRARATSAVHEARLTAEYPNLGLRREIIVEFLFPWAFLGVAFASGTLGGVVARRQRLEELGAQKHYWVVVLELACAGIGAALLYSAVLLGILPVPITDLMTVGYLPAILFGLVGGFMGVAAFELVIRLLKLLPT
jgi:hypothetical protein